MCLERNTHVYSFCSDGLLSNSNVLGTGLRCKGYRLLTLRSVQEVNVNIASVLRYIGTENTRNNIVEVGVVTVE